MTGWSSHKRGEWSIIMFAYALMGVVTQYSWYIDSEVSMANSTALMGMYVSSEWLKPGIVGEEDSAAVRNVGSHLPERSLKV